MTAGDRVERTELEEASGYTLVEDAPAQPGGFGEFGNAQTPLQFHAKALQNARKGSDATSVPPEAETRLEAILDDFAEKLGEEMLGEMASAAAGAVGGEAPIENSTDANGAEHERMNSGEEEEEFVLINDNDNRDKDGQFAEKGTGNQTGGPHETNLEKRQRTCQEALDKFNASTDHPSDDDVASGKVSIEEALEKGFSTTFAGHKLVFFTKQKITDKYVGFKDDPGRIKLVKEAVEKKNRMQPRPHNGEQTAFVESTKTSAPASKLLVVVADTKTGVVVSIMKAPVEYVRKHFK